MIVTAGGGVESQRVAYGTGTGVVHVEMLTSGAHVGPEAGTTVISAPVDADAGDTFGSGAAALAFADTSTAARLGLIYVVHNDGQGVEIARIDAMTGRRIDEVDTAVASSFGCVANGSPALSPPAAGGSRVLFVTLRGSCAADQSIVRIPIEGDASTESSTYGTQTFARIGGLAAGVGPSLAVLSDPGRDVALLRRRRARRRRRLLRSRAPAGRQPVAGDHYAGRLHRRPAGRRRRDDRGGAGGALRRGRGGRRVRRRARARALRRRGFGGPDQGLPAGPVRAVGGRHRRQPALTGAGAPAQALALSEVVEPGGVTPGGRLVVTSATRLTVLRTSDLAVVGSIAGTASGRGFARNVASIAGNLAFVSTDGAADVAPRQLALRVDTGEELGAMSFAALAVGAGSAVGQAAIARGLVVFGTPSGVQSYRLTEPGRPPDRVIEPPPCSTTLRGSARGDRLVGGRSGERILGGGGNDRLYGHRGNDCISGQSGADRIYGGPGRDRLAGGGGDDRIFGGSGRNRYSGGPGRDRIHAANHRRELIRCGRGRDRVIADPGDRVARDCERVRRVRRVRR